jgi:tRNA threonylcarbamoyladenosine biosynthesis protein TsaB
MNILIIDTSSNKEIIIGLKINGKEYLLKQPIDYQKAQVVLPLTEKLLKEHKLALSDIDKIEVNTGPGSFTGVRVGVSISNALAYLLKVPINDKKLGDIVDPVYSI